MGTVRIIDATVARAHEETGLREPAHRASEVSTIDGKDLESLPIQVSNPARNIGRPAIPGHDVGIPINSEPGLAHRKLFQAAKREPGFIAWLSPQCYGRHEIPQDRDG